MQKIQVNLHRGSKTFFYLIQTKQLSKEEWAKMEDTLIAAVSNQLMLYDIGHEKFKKPHIKDVAWLAVSYKTGVEL